MQTVLFLDLPSILFTIDFSKEGIRCGFVKFRDKVYQLTNLILIIKKEKDSL